jgi:hypothetical protein
LTDELAAVRNTMQEHYAALHESHTEAERKVGVLADALRDAAKAFEGANVIPLANTMRDTLRECGLPE